MTIPAHVIESELPPSVPSLREHPGWAQIRTSQRIGAWQVESWEEPCLPGTQSFDFALTTITGDGQLRLAVADAAVNRRLGAAAEPVALHGLATLHRLLAGGDDTDTAVQAAADELCDPQLRPRHRNPIMAAAVVDLDLSSGSGQVRRYADCEVWARRDGRWFEVAAGDMLTDAARARWQTRGAAAPAAGGAAASGWAVQEVLLDDPRAWVSPCVGLEPVPRPRVADLDGVDAVIVTTDGALLDAGRCDDLRGWLEYGLQLTPAGHPHPSPHGDIAVIAATLCW